MFIAISKKGYSYATMKDVNEISTGDPFGIDESDTIARLHADQEVVKKFHLNEKSLKFNIYPSYLENEPLETPHSTVRSNNFFARLAAKKIRRRLVEKDGQYNISLVNVEKQNVKYFADIFTTVIELKWRWVLTVFVFSFLFSWLLFAVVYYLIMLFHGDFAVDDGSGDAIKCLTNTKTFLAVFMFSLETQHTIGYGSRYPSEECPEIVIALCLQSIFGLMMQTLLAGVVFAKLSRPHKRAETLIFSRNACICMRDGRLCFLLRVGDMRKRHLAEAHVRVQLISKRITNEGELLPFQQFDMDVGYSTGLDRIFVAWPITICHVIDESSPLYEYSAIDLAKARFEITVILEGVVQSGATMQAISSYLPSEIIWGSRFEKLVTYKRDNGKYEIDFSKFHNVYDVDTPTLSAKEIDILKAAGLNFQSLYRCDNLDKVISSDDTPYDSIQKHENMHRKSIVHHVANESTNEYKLLLSFQHNDNVDDSTTSNFNTTPPYPADVNNDSNNFNSKATDANDSNGSKTIVSQDYEPCRLVSVDWSVQGILHRHHRRLSTQTRKLDDLIALSLESSDKLNVKANNGGPLPENNLRNNYYNRLLNRTGEPNRRRTSATHNQEIM